MKPLEPLVEPDVTNVKSPFANSPVGLLSASVARVTTHGAPALPTAVMV